MKEYVHALEERQQRAERNIEKIPNIEAVVLLKSETKDKALWKLGRVVSKITGKDGTVRGLKLKEGNEYIVERPCSLCVIWKLEEKIPSGNQTLKRKYSFRE